MFSNFVKNSWWNKLSLNGKKMVRVSIIRLNEKRSSTYNQSIEKKNGNAEHTGRTKYAFFIE